MAKQRQPRMSPSDQDKRDRDLDRWMDRALGVRKPDPEPVLTDL